MRAVLAVLWLLITVPAWAEWLKTAENEGAAQYLDPESIRKYDNLRQVWVLQDLEARNALGEKSRRILAEYDCDKGQVRSLSISHHSEAMATGNVISTIEGHSKWVKLSSDSIGWGSLKFVCAR